MLARDLGPQKQSALAALAASYGWKVVKEDLFADALRQAQNDMIKIDPDDPNYERKIASAQQYAKCLSDVTQVLIRSIEVHTGAFAENDLQTKLQELRESRS